MSRDSARALRGPALEVALAAAALILFAWLGAVTGWKGPPKSATSTAVWPFYFDTWFPQAEWSWRVLLPLVGLALSWWPMRRFVDGDRRRIVLLALLASAYAVHLGAGVVRHGFERGLSFTFSRPQEYWNDVRFVHAGFLARFPEVGRLSQHGATHPPGLTLMLAGLYSLGVRGRIGAEIVCSTACVLAAPAVWGAARRFTDETTARFAMVFFLFTGSVVAFSVMAMDAVTLLVVAVSLYGFARALDDRQDASATGGVLWGTALAFATLCTLTAFTVSLSFGTLLVSRRISGPPIARRSLVALACGPLAFFSVYAVLVVAFGYRPLHVAEVCIREFARSDDARRSAAVALLGNPVAFLGSLGLPMTGLATRTLGGALARLYRRNADDLATSMLVLAALLPPLFCTLLGKPRAEVERIYLLFVPMLMIASAAAARSWYHRSARWLTWFVVPALVVQAIVVEVCFETMW